MDEKTILELLDYVQSHYNDPEAIHIRLEQCSQAMESASQVKRWDWVIDFAYALLYHFVYSRSLASNGEGQDTEQISEVMKSFWEQGRLLIMQGLRAAKQVENQDAVIKFLEGLARLAGYLGDFKMAMVCLKEEARLVRPETKKAYVARELHMLGNKASSHSNFLAARACYRASLDILQELDKKRSVAEELDFMAANETMRIEKGKAGEQFNDQLRSTINSLWELSDTLRREAEFEQAASTDGEPSSTAGKMDKEAVDSTYQRLRDTLAKLDSLT